MNLFDRFLKGHRTVSVQVGRDRVEVFDWGYERVVKYNGVVYSRLNTESLYTHEYWDFFIPMGFIWEKPELLMIGLGGGTIAFEMNKLRGSAVSIEAVDINKEMIEIMKGFLTEDVKLKVAVGDGAESSNICVVKNEAPLSVLRSILRASFSLVGMHILPTFTPFVFMAM